MQNTSFNPRRLLAAAVAAGIACGCLATTPAHATEAQARADAERQRADAAADAAEREEAAAERAAEERAAAQRELRETQTELARLAARVAELSRREHRDEIERVMHRTSPLRPVLGVVLQDDPAKGVRIAAVSPDSGAEAAGLKAGDRLLAIDGKTIDGDAAEARLDRARDMLSGLSTGTEVKLLVESEGRQRSVTAKPRELPGFEFRVIRELDEAGMNDRLGELVAPRWAFRIEDHVPQALCEDGSHRCLTEALGQVLGWRGVRLSALNPKLGRYFGSERGVLVLSNDAEVAGIEPGDVLLEIDGKQIEQPSDAMRLLRQRVDGNSHAVQLLRDHKRRKTQLETPRAGELPLLLPLAPPAPPSPPSAPPPPAPPAPAAAVERPATVAPAARVIAVAATAAVAPPAPPAPSIETREVTVVRVHHDGVLREVLN